MIAFALASFLLMITPGPGVLTTAGVGSAFGFRAGLNFLCGLFVGTNTVALAVITGLSAVIFSIPGLRIILMGASTAYLLYLAVRIALSGSRIAFMESARVPGFGSGVLLQLINPKAYAVNTMLFSGFAFMPGALLTETIVKLLIVNVIWVPIHLLWLWAGVALKNLDLSARSTSVVNLLMASAMLATVVLAVYSQFVAKP